MQSQSLSWVVGRALFAHKAGYVCTLLLLLTGCVTLDQRAGFSDVSAAVEARSGTKVVWSLGTELDTQEDQEVRALLQYNAMQLGVFDLLRAREQQIQAAAAYIETLLDYWLARTNLGHILSGRLPNGHGHGENGGGHAHAAE
jgi:hypothetical protein